MEYRLDFPGAAARQGLQRGHLETLRPSVTGVRQNGQKHTIRPGNRGMVAAAAPLLVANPESIRDHAEQVAGGTRHG